MSNLNLTDEEIEDFTPKVHGILNWFGKLNEVDLDAVNKDIELYRDKWVTPLRPDEPEDFVNMEGIYENAGERWQAPYIKVPSVDKKEKAAATQGWRRHLPKKGRPKSRRRRPAAVPRS